MKLNFLNIKAININTLITLIDFFYITYYKKTNFEVQVHLHTNLAYHDLAKLLKVIVVLKL